MSKVKNATSIGGQALIEGVMMKGPDKIGIAVRKPDGEIQTKVEDFQPINQKHKIFSLPIIRGVVNFFYMMKIGYKTLMYSAEVSGQGLEDEEPSKFEKWLSKTFKVEIFDVIMAIGMVMGVALAVGLFIFLPTFLTGLITRFVDISDTWRTVIEAVIKLIIFVAYIGLTALMPEIKRVYQYHGAEHKTIFCYENGGELTPESAKKFSRFHPRCGTSFLTITILLSIIVYSNLSWESLWLRMVIKIICLPVIMGISYEIIKLAGKYDNILTRIISFPGMLAQRLTTKEPDEGMLEVAITAFKLVCPQDREQAKW